MPYKLIPPDHARRQTHWRVRGTEFGIYLDRSTGASDRKTAQRILARWRSEAQEEASRPQTVGLTFASAALSYMRAGGERRNLPALLGHFGETPLARIGQSEIDSASVALYPSASPATRNRSVYTPISAVMRHAGHLIPLKRPKGGYGTPRRAWLKPDEAKRLIEAARSVEERFGIFCMFLLYSGCRLGEAVNLTPANLNIEERTVHVPKTKNGRPRIVHLPDHVAHALAALPGHLPRFTKTVFGLTHRRRTALMLNEAFARAGLPKPKGVAFHLFRHTYGAYMRRFGGLDTSGLVATGAWDSRQAASVYEHVVASEEARKADLFPVWD